MASRQPLAALGSLFRASLLALCCALLWSGTAVAGPRVVSPEYVCPYCKPQPLRCSPEMSGIDCFSCGQVSTAALACNPALKSECPASVEHRKDKNGQCCYPTQMTCDKCNYIKTECEWIYGCNTSKTNVGCGCGNGTQCYDCAGTPHGTARNDGCGCGAGKSCYGCDLVPNSGKKVVCGVCGGQMGPCGCSACPPPPPSCNHSPVAYGNRNLISLHFGTGNNDSNGVLSDVPQYREICKNALGASSYDAVVYYNIHEATFSSPGNNAICSYKPYSSTQKHCVNAKNVGNPKHIAQISCRCN